MVVLMQFSITRWVSRYRPLFVMTVGTLMYAVGFALYGFVGTFALFLLAMVIITLGEMFVSPVSQAIAASLAPADMRGRYMAVYGLSWTIPFAIGPLLAGLVMDNADPRWVWYASGLLGVVAALAYFSLEWQIGRVRWKAVARRLGILQQVESGGLSAERAASELAAVSEGSWGRLADGGEAEAQRFLRVRRKPHEFSAYNLDLRIPLGLVHAALAFEGRLSETLDAADEQRLQRLVAAHAAPNTGGGADGADEGPQFDIKIEE
jgi:MFS family permease